MEGDSSLGRNGGGVDAVTARDDMDEAVGRLADAIRAAWELCEVINPSPVLAGVNLPELLAEALERVSEDLGGPDRLVAHRSGSWEAALVLRLAGG